MQCFDKKCYLKYKINLKNFVPVGVHGIVTKSKFGVKHLYKI